MLLAISIRAVVVVAAMLLLVLLNLDVCVCVCTTMDTMNVVRYKFVRNKNQINYNDTNSCVCRTFLCVYKRCIINVNKSKCACAY